MSNIFLIYFNYSNFYLIVSIFIILKFIYILFKIKSSIYTLLFIPIFGDNILLISYEY